MDSAEGHPVAAVLQAQESRLSRQEEFQVAMAERLNFLLDQVQHRIHLSAPPSVSVTPAAPTPAPAATGFGPVIRLASPERFSGEPGQCKPFLIDCSIHYEHTPHAFPTERSKIAFMISHLTGRARAWATAEWARESPLCSSLAVFTAALQRTFDPVSSDREKAQELMGIRQGTNTVCDYAILFRTLAAESGWNSAALFDFFLKGLAAPIRELLVPLDLPSDLDSLIALAIRTDNRLREIHPSARSRPGGTGRFLTASAPEIPLPSGTRPYFPTPRGEEPMQLGRARLSREERQRRLQEGRCFYCGEPGHLVATCTAKRTIVVSDFKFSGTTSRTLTTVQVVHHTTTELKALIDSGADERLMDWELVEQLGLDTELLAKPIRAKALNGQELFTITHITAPLKLCINHHRENIRFYVFKSPSQTLILGQPWLFLHNPHINWRTGEILGWGGDCVSNCLNLSVREEEVTNINLISVKPTADPNYPDLSSVPSCYHHLKEVFNKTKALSLPPHRPYDCAIELIPGSTIPKGRLYAVSGPERGAMREYIETSLKAGLIRPSSSPAGAGFFFVGKKDGSLRPCIDYSPLNDITIKNRYPLPLMPSVFDQLQQAKIFTKLDLRNAYHLVRIREGDEWKTGFNTPSGHYEYKVMPFGLTNAPATFQAMINDVLRDFLDHFVYVYLDDILIYSSDLKKHQDHVTQVLKRLLENKLYVKAEKSEFHADTVSFLGFIVAPGRVQMDPAKISAVVEWPTPDSRKRVQQFLGFANFYRRFIRGFSAIAAPLHALTSTQVQFHWSPEADAAFRTLKHRFTSAPILILPDP